MSVPNVADNCSPQHSVPCCPKEFFNLYRPYLSSFFLLFTKDHAVSVCSFLPICPVSIQFSRSSFHNAHQELQRSLFHCKYFLFPSSSELPRCSCVVSMVFKASVCRSTLVTQNLFIYEDIVRHSLEYGRVDMIQQLYFLNKVSSLNTCLVSGRLRFRISIGFRISVSHFPLTYYKTQLVKLLEPKFLLATIWISYFSLPLLLTVIHYFLIVIVFALLCYLL